MITTRSEEKNTIARRGLTLGVLVVIALARIFWPEHVQIDWPTLVLISIILILIFAPEIPMILRMIKRLRIGNAEIETRDDVAKLHTEVEVVEHILPADKTLRAKPEAAQIASGRTEADILALAADDKQAAIILLAIEIEEELARLTHQLDVPDSRRTIRQTVEELVSKNILTRELAEAIISFRNVRNKVAHAIRQTAVDDSILTSAVDSGVRILRILRSL